MTTEFERILRAHQERWPLMEPRDYGKLAYQSEFGPEHLVSDEDEMLRRIQAEWEEVAPHTQRLPEPIGGGLCRFHMNGGVDKNIASAVLVKLFFLTAKETSGTRQGLEEKLELLEKLPVSGMREWLADYRAQGCPPVRHSETYRVAYAPHYRLLKLDYARFFPALAAVEKLVQAGGGVVAIDGDSGSGKSTLARLIARLYDCNVFSMDDFYLPQSQRAENWMDIPAGNMDLERFSREVLAPVRAGEQVLYRVFDCSTGTTSPGEQFEPRALTVVEGSYSQHPALGDYDLRLFLTCGEEEQLRRLREREGDYFPTFCKLWLPLARRYAEVCRIPEKSDLVLDTGIL